MLAEEIKRRMFVAMKAKRTVEKEILRVALGEIQMAEARMEGPATDELAVGVVKKLLKANQESLNATADAQQRQALAEEMDILQSLLPQSLGVEKIIEALEQVKDQIAAAKADGPATGIAMKHLKSQALAVDGKDVSEAVKRMRAGQN